MATSQLDDAPCSVTRPFAASNHPAWSDADRTDSEQRQERLRSRARQQPYSDRTKRLLFKMFTIVFPHPRTELMCAQKQTKLLSSVRMSCRSEFEIHSHNAKATLKQEVELHWTGQKYVKLLQMGALASCIGAFAPWTIL